jgi:hypothetical protein
MGKNLQAALERGRGNPAPVTITPPPSPAVTQPGKTPSRAGKVHVGAYLSSDFKRSLMLVRAQTGHDVQTLIAQALNDLFRAHNVPIVDHD